MTRKILYAWVYIHDVKDADPEHFDVCIKDKGVSLEWALKTLKKRYSEPFIWNTKTTIGQQDGTWIMYSWNEELRRKK